MINKVTLCLYSLLFSISMALSGAHADHKARLVEDSIVCRSEGTGGQGPFISYNDSNLFAAFFKIGALYHVESLRCDDKPSPYDIIDSPREKFLIYQQLERRWESQQASKAAPR